MPDQLSPAMLAEVSKPRDERKIDVVGRWYGPTTQTWGRWPIGNCQWGTGGDEYWRPRVSRWGEFSEEFDLVHYGIGVQSKKIEVVESTDPNSLDYKWWSKLDGSGYRLAGTVLVVYLSSPRVQMADWFQLFSGALESGWDHIAHDRWALSFRPLDAALTSTFGVAATESDFPQMSQSLLGLYFNIPYGRWQSLTAEEKGCLTAIRDSTSTATYILSVGRCISVDAVYSAGALVAPAGYTVSYPVVHGRVFTRLTFAVDPGANVITADVHGLETVGDGTGTFLDTEVAQIEHMLHNFAFNHSGGMWYTRATAPILGIDTASFDAAHMFLANRANATARRGARLITSSTPLAELGVWSQTTGIPAYWRRDGKLSLVVPSPHKYTYVSTPVLSRPRDFAARVQWPAECSVPCNRVAITLGDSRAGIKVDMVVRDSMGATDRADNQSFGWGPATAR